MSVPCMNAWMLKPRKMALSCIMIDMVEHVLTLEQTSSNMFNPCFANSCAKSLLIQPNLSMYGFCNFQNNLSCYFTCISLIFLNKVFVRTNVNVCTKNKYFLIIKHYMLRWTCNNDKLKWDNLVHTLTFNDKSFMV